MPGDRFSKRLAPLRPPLLLRLGPTLLLEQWHRFPPQQLRPPPQAQVLPPIPWRLRRSQLCLELWQQAVPQVMPVLLPRAWPLHLARGRISLLQDQQMRPTPLLTNSSVQTQHDLSPFVFPCSPK